jgi:hypothetical protein
MTNVNMLIPKSKVEGNVIFVPVSHVCAGVHILHFRELKRRFLHVASLINEKAYYTLLDVLS